MKNNKKILLGIAVLVAGVGVYFFMKRKKANTINIENSGNDLVNATLADGTIVTLGEIDPTGAVFVILGGKRYGFVSDEAFKKYGYKPPIVIEKTVLDTLTDAGFVNETGKVTNYSGEVLN